MSQWQRIGKKYGLVADESRCRDQQPSTRPSSKSPVKEREGELYEQESQDHGRGTHRDS